MFFLLYGETNSAKAKFEHRAEIRATAVNISWVTVNCFLFDVIVFAMLPTHGIWREIVSLLDVMWPWCSQWMGVLYREKRQLYNKYVCYIARLSLNKMSTVIGWFLVTCPWSNSNVSQPEYNCAVVACTPPLFQSLFLLYKSLNI